MRNRVASEKRRFARRLRGESTDAKHQLWRLLRSRRLLNAKFRRQVPIGSWVVDFEHRLIVEADGSQHGESAHDMTRDLDLRRRGFRILRFWNNDILNRSGAVLEQIVDTIDRSPSPGFAPDGAQPPSPTRGEGKRRNANG